MSVARRRHAARPKNSSAIYQASLLSQDYGGISRPTAGGPHGRMMNMDLSQDYRAQSQSSMPNAQGNPPQSWSSHQSWNPTPDPGSEPTTRPPSLASTPRLLLEPSFSNTTDPFLIQIDKSEFSLGGGQPINSSRSSPAPGPSRMRPSTRARGAKSWRPLDLTKIQDPESEFPEAANASLDMQRYDFTLGQSETRQPSGQTLSRYTPIHASPIQFPPARGLDSEAGHHYNPADQFQRPQAQLSGFPPMKYNYSAIYGNHQSAVNQQLPTLYNRNEILHVFGSTLPGPDHLQRTTGSRDGQVQFIQHPNGDVSAHQWTAALHQWTNLGQYSNTRRRIEGQLASDRIKGQPSSVLSQLDTLAYFRAVASQRETQARPEPTFEGVRKHGVATTLFESSNRLFERARSPHVGPELQNRPFSQQSTATNLPDENSNLTNRGILPSQPESSNMSAWHAASSPSKAYNTNRATRHENSPCIDEENAKTNSTLDDDYPAPAPFNNRLTRQALSSGSEVQSVDMNHAYTDHGNGEASEQHRQSYRAKEGSEESYQGEETALNQMKPDLKVRLPFISDGYANAPMSPSQYDQVNHSSPDLSRNSNYNSDRPVMRTVLHDPLRPAQSDHSRHLIPHSEPTSANPAKKPLRSESPYSRDTARSPLPSSAADFCDPLHVSEPEEERPSRPVYYNIFDADAFDTGPQPSYKQQLDEWWHSYNWTDGMKGAQGDIPHTTFPGSKPFPRSDEATNGATNSLLSLLYGALASYAKEPFRRHYLSHFGDPPEWCVDKTIAGSKSFFGEDWGTPPSRVGRDPRYRPVVPDVRYAMYDEQDRRTAYDARYRFGGSRGF